MNEHPFEVTLLSSAEQPCHTPFVGCSSNDSGPCEPVPLQSRQEQEHDMAVERDKAIEHYINALNKLEGRKHYRQRVDREGP